MNPRKEKDKEALQQMKWEKKVSVWGLKQRQEWDTSQRDNSR